MKTSWIRILLLVSGMFLGCCGCHDTKQNFAGAPLTALQTFVADLEQSGWLSDTVRVRKVSAYTELKSAPIQYFNNRPFYAMGFEGSEIHQSEGSVSLDQTLFGNVRSIWAYFYRKKGATEWISDGVIEQWEFENSHLATEAMQQLAPVGDEVYFNTTPYFCRIQQYLIIFHTRSNAFSYDQAPLFEQFVRQSKAVTFEK
jgi:hypothetical protein